MASPVRTRGGKEIEFFPGNFTHLKCYISALHMHFNFSFNVDGRSWKCFREITLERGTSPGCKLCVCLFTRQNALVKILLLVSMQQP